MNRWSFLVPKILRGCIPESILRYSHCLFSIPTDSCDCLFFCFKMFRPGSQLPGVRNVVRGHPYATPAWHHSYQPGLTATQPYTLYNPNRVQQQEVSANREEGRYRDSLCQLCSEEDCQIYHHHVSSQAVRDFARRHQNSLLYNCFMCRAEESVAHPTTRKVILTSSTLYNVWTYQELNLQEHMEIECVVGGRIRDLTRALLMLYLKHPERIEAVLIAGINNIGERQPVPDIIEELWEMKDTLRAHSELNGHRVPSVVSFSTVIYAPKYCSLDLPSGYPEWVPPPNFLNQRQDIESLNAAIAAINKGSGVNYLNLHLEGIRIDPRAGKKMHKLRPERQIWREGDVRKRLHFTPSYKVKITNRAARLLQGGLTNPGAWIRD